jgi:competence protein ComEC
LKKITKPSFKFSVVRLVIFIILAFLLVYSLTYSNYIETLINVGYSHNNATLDENGLVVHYVDVGQGDCIIIEFPDGRKMIIDSGTTQSKNLLLDYIDNNIFENPINEGVFDYMLITHNHSDHIGASYEILDNYQVNTVYRPNIYATYNSLEAPPENSSYDDSQLYASVIEKINQEPNCNVITSQSGLSFTGGDALNAYILTFYSPTLNYYSNENEYSPIVVLQYRQKSVMLTGDATFSNEENVLQASNLPQIDILKVAHHGAKFSTSNQFLQQISPEYAVITVGEENIYSHPHQETINRLLYSGIEQENILRTDLSGNIITNINTSGDINIFLQVKSLHIYVKWGYVVVVLIVTVFTLTFVKTNKTKEY